MVEVRQDGTACPGIRLNLRWAEESLTVIPDGRELPGR